MFCDADVILAPGAVDALLGEMNRQQADVFSVFARHIVRTWPERLLLPLITDVVLCFLPFPALAVPIPQAATAHGAVLAIRRPAYERLGGFASVRGELVEDVAIARRTRALGLRLGLALGGDLIRIRMYTGYREIIAGMGRGLVPVAGGRRWAVVAGLLVHFGIYTAPVALLRRSPVWKVALALGITERLLVEIKTGGRDWAAAALVPLSPLAAVPVVGSALRRRQTWRGRHYS